MRLVSYRMGGIDSWGMLHGTGVVDHRQLEESLPPTLLALIERCEKDPSLAQALAQSAKTAPAQPLASVTLAPCLPRPGKIICLGVNYIDHAKEGGNPVGEYPAIFLRCATSLLAHGAALRVPAISGKLDYEAELAVVIGRHTRFASEADALASVFAYACFNDATLRDFQRLTSQWTIGKNFDQTGGFGPCLVTPDELPPGCTGLRLQSRLNGRVMQDANTSDMVFGVARTISLLSQSLTLEPGDVILTGTPGGVGYARTPPVWMAAGDTIEVEIEGIGILSNPVQA